MLSCAEEYDTMMHTIDHTTSQFYFNCNFYSTAAPNKENATIIIAFGQYIGLNLTVRCGVRKKTQQPSIEQTIFFFVALHRARLG